MLNIGDVVLYGAQGVYKIDCTETKQIGKTAADYYVLRPVYNENTSVFVPVDNAVLTAKMLPTLSLQQADELVVKIPDINVLKFANEGEKQTEYRAILSSGDREKLVALIKSIYLEKETRRLSGKKLNILDEQTLRKAETLFYNEMAYVWGVTPSEAANKINF